ncbi:MAG: choice-of-anchor L domain-containing protein [Bacteroidota bacterium]|nr:choice-of-anchor L domain-containing protein [Bacteroidota bacterium]
MMNQLPRMAAACAVLTVLAFAPPLTAQEEGRTESAPPATLSKISATAADAAAAVLTARAACLAGPSTMFGNSAQSMVYATTLQGFPTHGSDYLLLSTGYASLTAGSATTYQSHNMSGASLPANDPYGSPNGVPSFDVATFVVPFSVPANGSATLSFDWRFGSEENPTYTTSYTDYFRADVFDGAGNHLGNIALLPNGSPVSTSTAAAYSNVPTGSSSFPGPVFPSPNDVIYNAMTPTYTSSIDLTSYAGQTVRIQFRLADARDAILNSAVFIDNLDLAFCPNATFTLSPSMLWPPNHTMRTVTVTPSSLPSCFSWELASVTSNEPDNGDDDGNTINDIQGVDAGTADGSFQLRAERSGIGTGRVYTATFVVKDADGIACSYTATVDVPLNRAAKLAAGSVHIPDVATLEQNFPNPFNPTTSISYQLHKDADVALRVHDALGREIATLFTGNQSAGVYTMPFDAGALASGTYVYMLTVDGVLLQRSMSLMK